MIYTNGAENSAVSLICKSGNEANPFFRKISGENDHSICFSIKTGFTSKTKTLL